MNAMAKLNIPPAPSIGSPVVRASAKWTPSTASDGSKTHDRSLLSVWTDGPSEVSLLKACRPCQNNVQCVTCNSRNCVCMPTSNCKEAKVCGDANVVCGVTNVVCGGLEGSSKPESCLGKGVVQAINPWSYSKGIDKYSHYNESPEEAIDLVSQGVDRTTAMHAESQRPLGGWK